MALADRVTSPPARPVHGDPCSIGTLLGKLDGEEREAFSHMLASHDWTARMVYDAVSAEGHQIGFGSIGKHRGEKCRCFIGRRPA